MPSETRQVGSQCGNSTIVVTMRKNPHNAIAYFGINTTCLASISGGTTSSTAMK